MMIVPVERQLAAEVLHSGAILSNPRWMGLVSADACGRVIGLSLLTRMC